MATDNSSSSLGLYWDVAETSKHVLCFLIPVGCGLFIPWNHREVSYSYRNETKKGIECNFHVTPIISWFRWGRTPLFWLGIGVHFADSGGLNLTVCQVPTLPCSVSPSSIGHGEKIRWKSSWVKIRTGRSLINYCHIRTRFDLRMIGLIYCQLITE